MSSPNTSTSTMKVIPDLAAELAAARAKITALEAEAQARKNKGLTCKMGTKGNVSVYGLGRFPVSLYAGQWERLIAHAPTISKFLADHAGELSRKPTTD